MKKILLSLTFAFCISNLPAVEYIKQQYPELTEFLNSERFQDALGDYRLKVVDKGEKLSACVNVITHLDGVVVKEFVLSTAMVNPELLSAPALQFILCHELGHLNDPNLMKKGLFPVLAWRAGVVGAIGYCGFIDGSVKSIAQSTLASIIGYAVVCYLARQGEYFADRFALQLTGNLDGAIESLNKRRELREQGKYDESMFPDSLQALFADHPDEQQRINALKNYN